MDDDDGTKRMKMADGRNGSEREREHYGIGQPGLRKP